jgi:hypothetical protein
VPRAGLHSPAGLHSLGLDNLEGLEVDGHYYRLAYLFWLFLLKRVGYQQILKVILMKMIYEIVEARCQSQE